MKPAYTTSELAALRGVGERAIQKQAGREGWEAESKGSGKDHKTFCWQVSSMPEHSTARAAILRAEAESAQNTPKSDAGSGAVLPDRVHRIALDRYRVVAAYRQQKAKSNSGKAALEAMLPAYNSGTLLPDVFARLGKVSAPTIYRWDKQLRDANDDWHVLADKRGAWTHGGPKGLGQIGPEAEMVLLKCYLQESRPSVSLAIRAMHVTLEKRGMDLPSEASCRRFLKRFSAQHNDVVVLRREGEKALKDKISPYITRDASMLQVGDVLFADGHVLNFTVKHPVTGKPHRPTLIVWYDWASRMPVGWEIMPTENTVAISSALRMAIFALGKYPRYVYIDNGKAFKGEYFTKTGAEFEDLDGLYSRLGIGVIFSRPYEARTKIVERFFGTFNEQAARMVPSYCGRDISDKPAHMMRNEPYHQALASNWVPTVQDAMEMFRAYVHWYGHQPHEGIKNRLPLEVLKSGRGPGVDPAELDNHFLWTKKVRPSRCGFVIGGVRFESDALYGLKSDILVKYSWADLSTVTLCHMDGRPFGQAQPTEAIHALAREFGGELDVIKLAEANKRQRQLKKATLQVTKALGLEGEGLSALPFVSTEKVPLKAVPKAKTKAPEAPQLSDEEAAKIEANVARRLAAKADEPAYTAPDFFRTKLERYAFLFEKAVKEGLPLQPQDEAFMAEYEASDEYRNDTGARFVRLRALYQQNQQTGEAM